MAAVAATTTGDATMFILFGFKVRGKVLDTGTFACPREGGDRAYERRELRRWFTLFFVPLIPLNVVGEVVSCTSCGSDWDPAVLSRPTTERLRGDLGGLVTLVARRLAGPAGSTSPTAVEFVESVGGDVAALGTDSDIAPSDLEARAAELHGSLSTPGVERLVASAMRVADADGGIDDDDLRVLTALARGLGLTESHFRGILATHREQRRA